MSMRSAGRSHCMSLLDFSAHKLIFSSSRKVFTWSSVNIFLSFCWHNIEVLIDRWWSRMEAMRDSVKNFSNYCHSLVFYGENCEIAISLPWKLKIFFFLKHHRFLFLGFKNAFFDVKAFRACFYLFRIIFLFWCWIAWKFKFSTHLKNLFDFLKTQ